MVAQLTHRHWRETVTCLIVSVSCYSESISKEICLLKAFFMSSSLAAIHFHKKSRAFMYLVPSCMYIAYSLKLFNLPVNFDGKDDSKLFLSNQVSTGVFFFTLFSIHIIEIRSHLFSALSTFNDQNWCASSFAPLISIFIIVATQLVNDWRWHLRT